MATVIGAVVYDQQPPSDSGSILIVEDEPELRRGLRRILTAEGHSVVEAGTSAEALELLGRVAPEVVVLDLALPDTSGFELLSVIRNVSQLAGVVVLTGSNSTQDMREALRLGAGAYLRKPADALTLSAQVSVALARVRSADAVDSKRGPASTGDELRLNELLEQLPFNLAYQLSHAWDLRHVETSAHVQRMAEYTRRLAIELGRSPTDAMRLGRVAMLHDIGKVAIPDAILTKPGKLTEQEYAIMKRHSEIGSQLLSGSHSPFLDLAARVARSHHERWDGSGYPDGLVGSECIWEARLVGVVDVYDAVGQMRCYKEAWPRCKVVELFQAERGKSFDPIIVDALLALIPELEAIKTEHPDSMRLTRPRNDSNLRPSV